MAEIAETAKRTRYPANAAAGLLAAEPFAIETIGRLGPGPCRSCMKRGNAPSNGTTRYAVGPGVPCFSGGWDS